MMTRRLEEDGLEPVVIPCSAAAPSAAAAFVGGTAGVAVGGFATASPRWFDGSGGMMTLSRQLGERATGDRLEGLRAMNYGKAERVCESQ